MENIVELKQTQKACGIIKELSITDASRLILGLDINARTKIVDSLDNHFVLDIMSKVSLEQKMVMMNAMTIRRQALVINHQDISTATTLLESMNSQTCIGVFKSLQEITKDTEKLKNIMHGIDPTMALTLTQSLDSTFVKSLYSHLETDRIISIINSSTSALQAGGILAMVNEEHQLTLLKSLDQGMMAQVLKVSSSETIQNMMKAVFCGVVY